MKNWHNITVGEYLEILDLQDDDLTPTELKIARVEIFEDVDEDIEDDELDSLLLKYSWLDKAPKYKKCTTRFNRISWGAFRDLEKFLTDGPPIQNIDKICARLTEFTDFEEACNLIKDGLLSEHLPTLDAYIKYRTKIIENYDDLFESNDEQDEDEDEDEPEELTPDVDKQEVVNKRWAWERIAYNLSGGDITKVQAIMDLPHLMVFNWLTMMKDLKL